MTTSEELLNRGYEITDALYNGEAGPAVTASRLRALLVDVWDDAHDHCTSIGCPNPYRP